MSDKTLRQSKRVSWVVPFCVNIEGFILDEVVILKKHVVFFKTDGVIEFQPGWGRGLEYLENESRKPSPIYLYSFAPRASPSPILIADET
jgi:hypothetical protein